MNVAKKKSARATAGKITPSNVEVVTRAEMERRFPPARLEASVASCGGQAVAGGDNPNYAPTPTVSDTDIASLRKAAFSKKYPQRFSLALIGLINGGKIQGRSEMMDRVKATEALHVERLKLMQEAHAINVVSAFMARVDAAQKLNKGPLPAHVVLDGYTVARVYDALRDAGYTTEGRDSGFRKRS